MRKPNGVIGRLDQAYRKLAKQWVIAYSGSKLPLIPVQVQVPLSAETIRLTTDNGQRRLACGVAAMPGLIESPGQIWLAVAPVDMPTGHKCGAVWMVCRRLSSKVWGIHPALGRPLSFATAPVTACSCCCGTATAFGYASAVYIRVVLSGPRSTIRYSRSVRRSTLWGINGIGWSSTRSGRVVRRVIRQLGESHGRPY